MFVLLSVYPFTVNMKYVAQTCLYDSTAATTALPTCEDACQPIRPVLKTLWLSKPQSAQYDYCSIHSGAFMSDSDECASCLRSISGSVILGNCKPIRMEQRCQQLTELSTSPKRDEGELRDKT